jgi:hypothetical protein
MLKTRYTTARETWARMAGGQKKTDTRKPAVEIHREVDRKERKGKEAHYGYKNKRGKEREKDSRISTQTPFHRFILLLLQEDKKNLITIHQINKRLISFSIDI